MKVRTTRFASVIRIGVCTAVALWLVPTEIETQHSRGAEYQVLSTSKIGTCYLLDDDRWTSFTLPPGKSVVLIATNAGVVDDAGLVEDDVGTDYAIEYEILRGEALRDSGVYSLRSKPKLLLDPRTGEDVRAQFYVNSDTVPLASRSFRLKLDTRVDERQVLRLRSSSVDGVADVTARVYVPAQPPEFKLRYLWQRLSFAKRKRLAEANVHTTDLLTRHEKDNLVSTRWTGVAPSGIENDDYVKRKIYSRRDDLLQDTDERSILPAGVLVTSRVYGTIPLPEGGGEIEVLIEVVDGDTAPPSFPVTLSRTRPDGTHAEESIIVVKGETARLQRKFGDGMLIVRSDVPVTVRSYLSSTAGSPEITPRSAYVPMYAPPVGTPIDYTVAAFWNDSTPYRVAIRRVFDDDQADSHVPVVVRVLCLDGEGLVIRESILQHQAAVSVYVRGTGVLDDRRLSSRSLHYLSVPKGTRHVRLVTINEGVLLSVATRLVGRPYLRMVPEDEFAVDAKGIASERADLDWSIVHPADSDRWRRSGHVANLYVRPRPRHLKGRGAKLRTRVLVPSGTARTLDVLSPPTSDLREVTGGRSARYVVVPTATTVTHVFQGGGGRRTVRPRVLCSKENASAAVLRFHLDGALHYERRLEESNAVFRLPPISVGEHDLVVTCSQRVRLLMNSIEAERQRVHVMRRFHAVDRIEYVVDKPSDDPFVVSLRLLSPFGSGGRCLIRARLQAPERPVGEPLTGWTNHAVDYSIRAGVGEPATPTTERERRYAVSPRFRYSLGRDLPEGRYVLTFEMAEGPSSFLQAVVQEPVDKFETRSFVESHEDAGDH